MENKPNELLHYGVLGMKWGRHMHPSSTYAKSVKYISKRKKAEKRLLKRSDRAEKRAKRYFVKMNDYSSRGKEDKALIAYKRVLESHEKSEKLKEKAHTVQRKREKFEEAFINTYSNFPIRSLKKRHFKKGKFFANMYLAKDTIKEDWWMNEK